MDDRHLSDFQLTILRETGRLNVIGVTIAAIVDGLRALGIDPRHTLLNARGELIVLHPRFTRLDGSSE